MLSDKLTEEELNKLERKLKKEYSKAYALLKAQADEYFERYKDRWQKEYKAYQNGVYTKEQFELWEQAQLGRGQHWEKLRDDMAYRMTHTNEIACSYINGVTPSVYSTNYNFTAFQCEKWTGIGFEVVNEDVVENLMLEKDNVTEFRTVSVNPKRDYEWNSKQIQSALTSGILQGKGIDSLAESFMTVMKRNQASAIRNARTAVTSAQNAGRMDMLGRAQSMGINVKKKWISTHDGRVRDSHAMLDGQIRDVDKAFANGLMFPADSSGHPREVYNCRCTMGYILPDYEDVKSNESYDEWLKVKNRELGTGSVSNVKPHRESEKIGKIDFHDTKAIDKLFTDFEKKNVNSDIELACVVTKEGEIFKCFGVNNAVYPYTDLGEKFIGAKVTHIHPKEFTSYSFSDTDISTFYDCQLEMLRGTDVKYTYILDRSGIVEDMEIMQRPLADIREDFAHYNATSKAIKYGYGYKRMKND